MSGTTQLHEFQLANIRFENPIDLRPLATGLQGNQSLISLHLSNLQGVHPHQWKTLFQSLKGHQSLRTLKLDSTNFEQDMAGTLNESLVDPTCKIETLDLSSCKMRRGLAFYSIRCYVAIEIIKGCHSLLHLSLQKNEFSSRDLQELLEQASNAPNLRVIDLSNNRIERFRWKKDTTQSGIKSCLHLRRLWLSKNPILHNRFRLRTTEELHRVIRMLQFFPSLCQIIPNNYRQLGNSRWVPFPDRIHHLMAIQYVLPHVSHLSPPSVGLWKYIIERADRVPFQEALMVSIPRQQDTLQKLQQSVRSSVLYKLIREHPALVTLEAATAEYSQVPQRAHRS